MRIIRKLFSFLEFPAGWGVVLGLVGLNTLLLSHTWLKLPAPWSGFLVMLLFIYIKLIYRWLAHTKTLSQPIVAIFGRAMLGLEYIVLCGSGIGYGLCLVSYWVCGLQYPLIDQQLNLMDQAIGFNWPQFFHWCHIQPVKIILQAAYASITVQLVFFAAWFAFLQRKERLYEMFWLFVLTFSAAILVSAFMPASGPASALGLEHLYNEGFRQALSDAALIRAGINPDFSTHPLGGIITFPSFHTSSALVYIYGFRKSGLLSTLIVLLNILMLFSIPAFGDHYFMDMLAGIAVSLISIAVVRFLNSRPFSTFAFYDLFPIGCLKPKAALVRMSGKEGSFAPFDRTK